MGCFVAVLNTDGAPIDGRLLRTMMDVPPFQRRHDATVWTSTEIGLSCAPLHASDAGVLHRDTLSIAFDGRLDDRASLVRHLGAREGIADAEIVLKAYERWGSACTQHLLGDFASCIWDAGERQLFCARDHLGVKPLYYAAIGTTIVVSNVLRSIRRHPAVSDRLDDHAICDLLLVGACMDLSRTSFADVARVPPAHTVTFAMSTGIKRVERYWSLQPGAELRLNDPREYVERYRSVLDTVVRDRLPSAPFGVLMSGGLDSSSVAAAAARAYGPGRVHGVMRAFTLVYDNVVQDEERRYSSIVADSLGIEIEHRAADGYRWFDRWNEGLLPPEPSTEPMTAMTADLLECASRHCTVALTGDGGDPAFLPSTFISLLGRRSPVALTRDLCRAAWQTKKLPPIGIRSTVRRWFSDRARARGRTGVPVWLSDSFVRRCDVHARAEELARQRTPAEGARGAAATAIADSWWTSMFETYDPGATQRPVGLRYPLFDVRFLSFALTLPTHPWCVDKEIVRSAMRGRLPDEVCSRPKTPLAVDILEAHGRWSVTDVARAIEAVPELEAYVDSRALSETVREERLLTDDEPGTWAVVALATWLRCDAGARMPA